MSVNNLPPLPPSFGFNTVGSASSISELMSALESEGNLGQLAEDQIKEMQGIMAQLTADLKANPPDTQAIATDLREISDAFAGLRSCLNNADMSTLAGYMTQLYTDIQNGAASGNYSAALTDLSTINGYFTASPLVDYISFLNAWSQIQNDLNANPPVESTVQADWTNIVALMTKLEGETTGSFQADIHSLQGYLTQFGTDITNWDPANLSYLQTTAAYIISQMPVLSASFL